MIIGITGYGGSGKDTAAEPLIYLGFKRKAFADYLKLEVEKALNTNNIKIDFNDRKQKEEYREVLVSWGKMRRNQDPAYWIKKADINPEEDTVITDVRYPNETEHILKLGGKVLWIYKEGCYAKNEEEEKSINDLTRRFKLGEEIVLIPNIQGVEELHARIMTFYNQFLSDSPHK